MVYLFKPATTPRAFSLRSNRCAARPEGLGGSCVPGQGLVRIEGSQIKKKPYRMVWFLFNRQLSILPGRFQPSTFDVWGLNYCVRDGNRWIPPAIATG